ncbi:MAG: hypothetical protein N0E59_12290 [Candidatus Thiodiazotropha taylori]|nr:hypothetical protein [Candidatus Thiodiazotropha taylori]MCG8083231.1 hypothetical protein [Candidatus Thiodiazotropha taylori]MCG8107542.1 hypothetical protein [Candidatus Thiodiazotropha taylori]MCG8111532.1 hypothetical protein [Candidatus Thiodiazotropha taylori]MCW4279879.1 hypothetical protein [Candidatus Thiodiazotropha taylori]
MKAFFATLLTGFGTLGILGALIFPIDNFSYVAASITASGIKTAHPVQLAVEAYQAKHGLFPDDTIIKGVKALFSLFSKRALTPLICTSSMEAVSRLPTIPRISIGESPGGINCC